MVFAHDTEVALEGAAALVNTDGRDGDTLTDPAALDAFVDRWGWTGSRTHDETELEEVRRLRPRLRRMWECDEDDAASLVNELLRDGRAMPQLVRHGDWGYHVHATTPEEPLATRMAVEAAMAFVDVIRSGELERLRTCAADDCDDVLVDLSRNRSKRFCDSGCANRVHVAAYRARREQLGQATG